ncbi:hypothetical protein ABIC45_003335 [Mucilaginibacter rubeus]
MDFHYNDEPQIRERIDIAFVWLFNLCGFQYDRAVTILILQKESWHTPCGALTVLRGLIFIEMRENNLPNNVTYPG